ncbi:hypothetical protein [Massilia sp. CF038]|uniref:hypothetical protein n=1 Tax=Massilia sp. CF038 TaxID=1881045 RepID=UPI00090F311F|nr:hypothetical protein [Massilia sp. CF038]SHH47276.1 hypothetical protein SAMN05428948_4183 [Massilia sp. CF038]
MAAHDGFESRTLSVALAPEMLSAVVRDGARVLACSEIRISPGSGDGHWSAGLAAFETWIRHAGRGLAGVPLAISVSTRWCQLTMLPWSDALLYQDSAQRYLQARFERLYGSAARNWELLCDDSARGQPRLACAVESGFALGLREVAQAHGHDNVRIESIVTATARTIVPAPCDRFALQEPGRLVLVARRYGRVVGIESQSCPASWPAALPPAWQQWTERTPEAGEVAQVIVFAHDSTAVTMPVRPWHPDGTAYYFVQNAAQSSPVMFAHEETGRPLQLSPTRDAVP